MFDELRKIFETHQPLSEKEWNNCSSYFKKIEVNKNQTLTKEGQIERYLYFIVKGGIRAYFLKNGKEHNVDFEFENEFTSSYISFLQQIPSDLYIQTIEPSIFLAITYKDINAIYDKYKVGERIGRFNAEKILIKYRDRSASLMIESADERFKKLLETKKEWIQRVSQKNLASFLNITPEYYSRLKNQFYSK